MKQKIDSFLSGVLTVAAVAMAVVVVRREFATPAPPGAAIAREPIFHDNWQEFLKLGVHGGNQSAPVRIIEFSDLECPFCRQFHTGALAQIKDEFNEKLSWTFIHLPLSIHRFAKPAAAAAECAAAAGRFWEFVDQVFNAQDSLGLKSWEAYAGEAGIADLPEFTRCRESTPAPARVAGGRDLADSLGIHGTPTVIVNGWQLPQPPSEQELTRIVTELLAGRSPFPDNRSLSAK